MSKFIEQCLAPLTGPEVETARRLSAQNSEEFAARALKDPRLFDEGFPEVYDVFSDEYMTWLGSFDARKVVSLG